jgi:hypothetical protein
MICKDCAPSPASDGIIATRTQFKPQSLRFGFDQLG